MQARTIIPILWVRWSYGIINEMAILSWQFTAVQALFKTKEWLTKSKIYFAREW